MQLWVKQRQQRQLKPTQLKLFLRQLRNMPHYLEPGNDAIPGDIQARLEAYMIDQQVDVQVVQAILDKAKAEAAAGRLKRKEQYQEWLQGACEGGMRGLYRALKSPENHQARPYRDQSGELRPHLRRRSGNLSRELNRTLSLTSWRLVRSSS